MTRKDILKNYDVDGHSIIRSPGKFEGAPIYTPYFYDLIMNDMADNTEYDEYDNPIDLFDITDDDIAQFPELKNITHIRLWQDDNGFVFCEVTDHKNRIYEIRK